MWRRVHKARNITVDVTWLKPGQGEQWWEAKWTPWKLQASGKGSRKGCRPWTTDGVEADTVQVTGLAPLLPAAQLLACTPTFTQAVSVHLPAPCGQRLR